MTEQELKEERKKIWISRVFAQQEDVNPEKLKEVIEKLEDKYKVNYV